LAAQAQSIGLYEGMMGDSGAAFKDSSAPSIYNPSLLSERTKDSYSLSANSFGWLNSKSDGSSASSLSLTPNYLGSVIVGTVLVHEIFLSTLAPSKATVVGDNETTTEKTHSEIQLDSTAIRFGYSMAFRSIPFALSYFAEFYQNKNFGVLNTTFFNSAARSVTQLNFERTSISGGISASGHINYQNYTLGFMYKTRPLNLLNKNKGTATSYLYTGNPAPNDYIVTQGNVESENSPLSAQQIIIGHSFKVGDHEFLTDSDLVEENDLTYRFKLTQSFGYRMMSSSGHQFLCGISHLINSEIKYFGQSAYYSAGYSWLTRTLRSAIGLYYYTSRLDQDVSAVGLTFGSEFNY